jgi:hypothetical protein
LFATLSYLPFLLFSFFHFSSGMIRSRDTDEQEDNSLNTEDQVHIRDPGRRHVLRQGGAGTLAAAAPDLLTEDHAVMEKARLARGDEKKLKKRTGITYRWHGG